MSPQNYHLGRKVIVIMSPGNHHTWEQDSMNLVLSPTFDDVFNYLGSVGLCLGKIEW